MHLSNARRLASGCAISAITVAALVAPGAASAAKKEKEPSKQCSGSSIIAAGSTLQKLAQVSVWDPDFNTSSNALACAGTQGSKGKPTVTYESIGSGAGLEDFGVNGHAFEGGRVAVPTTDEPPNETQKEEIEGNETTPTPETLETIPVLQGAAAIIVNLPTGCTATSTAFPGRLVLNNTTLEGIYRGTISKWSQITEDGDTLSGEGCEPETSITRVVRLDQSGTTHIFKKYLSLINGNSFPATNAEGKSVGNRTWTDTSEGPENTTWPTAAHVVRPAATGGGALVTKVYETSSSIGYANLADARSKFGGTGSGPGTAKFWAPIQHSGVSASKATYADPSTDGDTPTVANANCGSTTYTNGSVKFPPKSTKDVFNEVTTSTKEKNYPICGLTYDLTLDKYSVYPGTTEGEAQTAHDFESYVLSTATGGGQKEIANHDYEALPKSLLKEAQKGASETAF